MKDVGGWEVLPVLAVSIGAVYLFVRRKKLKLSRLLASRPQRTHEEFGATYFGESEPRKVLATEIREILSRHLPVPLEGLSPQDRFQEHLMLDTFDSLSSAEFILKIEKRYGIAIQEDEALKPDMTFRQLIDYVERRIIETKMSSRP